MAAGKYEGVQAEGHYGGHKLTQRQVALLWIAQGGSPARADLASAVVMGESGGYTEAGNYCCHGLYAFNVEVGVATMKCALNAICATKRAIQLSKNGKDWGPWEAYTNGSYSQFLGGSGVGPKVNKQQATAQLVDAPFHLPLPGPLDPGNIWEEAEGAIGGLGDLFGGGSPNLPGAAGKVEGIIGGVAQIAKFFAGLGELLLTPKGWLRLGKIIFGSIAVLWGVHILIRQTTGTDVAGGAKKVAEGAVAAATIK